jgi:hypothetical protein
MKPVFQSYENLLNSHEPMTTIRIRVFLVTTHPSRESSSLQSPPHSALLQLGDALHAANTFNKQRSAALPGSHGPRAEPLPPLRGPTNRVRGRSLIFHAIQALYSKSRNVKQLHPSKKRNLSASAPLCLSVNSLPRGSSFHDCTESPEFV